MAAEDYFQGVEKPRLSKEVARRITQVIKEGRFLPGQNLPSERELAQAFDVSRPILREALRILEIQGLIAIQQGRRTIVEYSPKDIPDSTLQEWLLNNQRQIVDSYEARLAVEPICAELAAQRATHEQVDHLKGLLAEAEVCVREKNITQFTGQDMDFHRYIAEMSGNPRLCELLDALITPEADVRGMVLHLPDHLEQAHEYHLRILLAIEARDPRAAREAMERALSHPIRRVQKLFERKAEG